MSFPNPNSSFMVQRPYSDAIGIWPQYNNEQQSDSHSQFDHQPPPKRPRNYEEISSNSPLYPPRMNQPMINPPINRGTTNIFFKTRICAKFKQGTCRNGADCNFAHGLEDLRQPPPNWQELVGGGGASSGGGAVGGGGGGSGSGARFEEDRSMSGGNWDDDQKIIYKMKLCKKFYNGEECTYGDRCNFLHEDPSKFRDDIGRYRESSAISIGTTGPVNSHGGGSNQSEINKTVNNNINNLKPVYWKTKLCIKWTTGQCPFGEKCHFAHGEEELQGMNGRVEGEAGNVGSAPLKAQPLPTNDASCIKTVILPSSNKEGQRNCKNPVWEGAKKANRIYADWLDDLPLALNLPNQVES